MKLAFTRATVAAAAIVAFAGMPMAARAQTVQFAGATAGCFFTTTACSGSSGVQTFGGMPYTSSTFDHARGGFFRLPITFSAPADRASDQIFTAALMGSGTKTRNGPKFDFDNNRVYFGRSNSDPIVARRLTLSMTTVPEPASMTLVGIGLLGLAGFARRRRRAGLPS